MKLEKFEDLSPVWSTTMIEKKVGELLEKQQNYFYTIRTKPFEFRKQMLQRLGKAVEVNEDRITRALFDDLRKSAFEVYISEIGMVKAELRSHLRSLRSWMKPERVRTPHCSGHGDDDKGTFR